MKRHKTNYPGVFFREAERVGAGGTEKIFYVVYKRNGKTIEAKAGRQYADDMTAARANQYRTALIEGRAATPREQRAAYRAAKEAEASRWSISRLWAKYCETHAANKILRAESLKYDRYLRGAFGDKEPGELLALDVDRLRIKLQKQGKLTTAARVLEILRRIVNFGVKRGLSPPISFKIEVPKLNNEITEDLSEEQIQALLKALEADPDQKAVNIMRLAMVTGMRRGEIMKLQWQDLDFRKRFIHIVDPKGGPDQVIPMNDSARVILNGIGQVEGNPYVFPGKLPGRHLTECRRSFDRIREAAGLPEGFRPLHGLRHAFASMLASSGQVDMYTLQKLLTHKSPQMTQRYAHLRDEALKKASDLAGSIIQRAANGGAKEVIRLNQRTGA